MSLQAILETYSGALFAGLIVTVRLCLLTWAASFFFGILFGSYAAKNQAFGFLTKCLSAVLSGVPVIVALFWLHYPAQAAIGVVIDPFVTAAVTLSVLGTFMVSEAVRQVLEAFPTQYRVAAQVSGLSGAETFWRITVPIVAKEFMPAALMIMVTIFHMTLLCSLISVEEVFRVAQRVNSVVYRPVEIYTALALFCVLVSLPLHLAALTLRARLTRDTSER